MPAGVFDFPCERGSTFYYTIQLFGEKIDEDMIDLTGYAVKMQIRKSAVDDIIIATPTTRIVNAQKGIISIYLSAEETAKIETSGDNNHEYEKYVYDITIDTPTSNGKYVKRILNGYFYVSPRVTN